MFAKIIRRRKPQSGGLRVTRRGRRKYAVIPVRDVPFCKATLPEGMKVVEGNGGGQ